MSRGAEIGLTGQTGDTVRSNGHLHFEVLHCETRSGYRADQNVNFFAAGQIGGERDEAVSVRGNDGEYYTFRRVNPRSFLPLNDLAPNRL